MLSNNRENIDKTLFNEKSLSLLNIRDLRDIGRKFGIPSPTTMKKKDLVNEILKIVYGVVEVPVRNTCGRPSSREFDINKYITKIKNNTDMVDEISKIKLDMDYGTLMVSDKSEKYDSGSDIEIRVFYTDGAKCYLRVCEFVQSDGDIEISMELAKKFALENLDVLEILHIGQMFKIISINGEKVKDKFKGIKVCGNQIRTGVGQDFSLSTNEEIEKEIESLVKACEKQDIKMFILSKKEYVANGLTCATYKIDESKTSVYKKIVTLLGKCKEALTESEDIIMVLDSIDDIGIIFDKFDDDIKFRIKNYLKEGVSKVVELSNAFIYFRLEEVVLF